MPTKGKVSQMRKLATLRICETLFVLRGFITYAFDAFVIISATFRAIYKTLYAKLIHFEAITPSGFH